MVALEQAEIVYKTMGEIRSARPLARQAIKAADDLTETLRYAQEDAQNVGSSCATCDDLEAKRGAQS